VCEFPTGTTRYVSKASDKPTNIPDSGLSFSLVFRAEPGEENVLLKITSAYDGCIKTEHSATSIRPLPPK